MFRLIKNENRVIQGKERAVRTYRNEQTTTELTTYLLTNDKFGGYWWTFEDLFTVPFIRQMAAKKVVDLYGYGLTMPDIMGYTAQIKTLLRSNDAEKYEKIYAEVLKLESLTSAMADPVKQCIGLSTVYLLYNDERPDAYVQSEQNVKMSVLAQDIDLQAFFLNWWTDIMKDSGQVLKGLSRIASTIAQS